RPAPLGPTAPHQSWSLHGATTAPARRLRGFRIGSSVNPHISANFRQFHGTVRFSTRLSEGDARTRSGRGPERVRMDSRELTIRIRASTRNHNSDEFILHAPRNFFRAARNSALQSNSRLADWAGRPRLLRRPS